METASVSHYEEHQHAVISFADVAKISKVFDTCKLSNKKIEKQRDFKAPQALSGDTELTARAANVLNSAAKLQNNSETTKDLAKKTLPPSNYRTRIKSRSQQQQIL